MESHTIQLTGGAIKNNKLNVRTCGINFFPSGVVGGSTKDKTGERIIIKAVGLKGPIKTDIPSDKRTGKPRWFLRERSAVGKFYNSNSLTPGDIVEIKRVSKKTYELIPHYRKLKFIDLFAGIGGTRLAFEKAGCECVFSSEWDRFAQQTYEANFGEKPYGDIREIQSSEIPDHDILVAGFPCQPFSISGVSKKNFLH